jgi:hypothetical protein
LVGPPLLLDALGHKGEIRAKILEVADVIDRVKNGASIISKVGGSWG